MPWSMSERHTLRVVSRLNSRRSSSPGSNSTADGSASCSSRAFFWASSIVEYLKPVSRNWLVKAMTRNGTRYLRDSASRNPKFEVGSPSGQPKCSKVSRPTNSTGVAVRPIWSASKYQKSALYFL
jgi:hypothetical protein